MGSWRYWFTSGQPQPVPRCNPVPELQYARIHAMAGSVASSLTKTLLDAGPDFDAAPGFLVLRIRKTARHGQTLRLAGSQCRIGAASDCTLRVRSNRIDALHCVIWRGAQMAHVLCHSPRTRLNGQRFTAAELKVGDLLSLGPVEFEVVALHESADKLPATAAQTEKRPANPPEKDAPPSSAATAERRDETNDPLSAMAEAQRRWRAEHRRWSERQKAWARQLAAWKAGEVCRLAADLPTDRRDPQGAAGGPAPWQDEATPELPSQHGAKGSPLGLAATLHAEPPAGQGHRTAGETPRLRPSDRPSPGQAAQEKDKQVPQPPPFLEQDVFPVPSPEGSPEQEARKAEYGASQQTNQTQVPQVLVAASDPVTAQQEQANSQRRATQPSLQEQEVPLRQREEQLALARGQFERLRSDLEKQQSRWRQQSVDAEKKLLQQKEEVKAQQARLGKRQEQQMAREEALDELQRELEARAQFLDARQTDLQQQVMQQQIQLKEKLAHHQHAVAQHQDELQSERRQLEQERQEFEEHRAEWQRQAKSRQQQQQQVRQALDDAAVELAGHQQQLADERQALETICREMDSQKEAFQQRLEEELAAQRAELEQQREAVVQQREALQELGIQHDQLAARERTQVEYAYREIATAQHQLDAAQNAFETLRAQWEEYRETNEREMKESTRAVEAEWELVGQARQEMEAERRALKERQEVLAAEQQAQNIQQQQLEVERDELDCHRRTLAAEEQELKNLRHREEELKAEVQLRLEATEEQLAADREKLVDQRREFETWRQQKEQELKDKHEQLVHLEKKLGHSRSEAQGARAELERAQAEFQQRNQADQAESTEEQNALRTCQQQLNVQQEQLAAARESLQKERAELDHERFALNELRKRHEESVWEVQQFAEEKAVHEQEVKTLAAQREQFQAQRAALAQEQDHLKTQYEQLCCEREKLAPLDQRFPEGSQAADSADAKPTPEILAPAGDDHPPQPSTPLDCHAQQFASADLAMVEPNQLSVPESISDGRPAAGPEAAEHSLAEVDAYMTRLLDRVEDHASTANEPSQDKRDAHWAKNNDGQCLKPCRSSQPEKAMDILAMREVANRSTRAAIEHSRRSKVVANTLGKCLIAVMSLAMGLVIFYLSHGSSFLGVFGAFAAGVAAILWAFQALLIWQRGQILLGANRGDRQQAEFKVVGQAKPPKMAQQANDELALADRDFKPLLEEDGETLADGTQRLESPLGVS